MCVCVCHDGPLLQFHHNETYFKAQVSQRLWQMHSTAARNLHRRSTEGDLTSVHLIRPYNANVSRTREQPQPYLSLIYPA